MASVHEVKKSYKCNTCDSSFTKKTNLNEALWVSSWWKETIQKRFKEENRKGLSLFDNKITDMKEFKVQLGGNDTEKVLLPIFGDDDRDENLRIMVKDFSMMIEDGRFI